MSTFFKDDFDCISDPVPSDADADHYKSFADCYGQETDEKFRPSLQTKKVSIASTAKDLGIRICGETVRAVIHCEECNKPRYLIIVVSLHTQFSTKLDCKGINFFFPCHSFKEKKGDMPKTAQTHINSTFVRYVYIQIAKELL